MTLFLKSSLDLDRCPHCGVNSPNITKHTDFETKNINGDNPQFWCIYICRKCGGVITAKSIRANEVVSQFFPRSRTVEDSIPEPARSSLLDTYASVHIPAGAVMLAGKSVNEMLIAIGYDEDEPLYDRINKAKDDGKIIEDMAVWAHRVRLDSNKPRHPEGGAPTAYRGGS